MIGAAAVASESKGMGVVGSFGGAMDASGLVGDVRARAQLLSR